MKTVSIETAKSLVANGIVVESENGWCNERNVLTDSSCSCIGDVSCYKGHTPAPTADEILPFLPYTVWVNGEPQWFEVDQCQVSYRDIKNYITKVDGTDLVETVDDYNIAEAMAKTLLKLKELKLI